jgi:hypothetical protein
MEEQPSWKLQPGLRVLDNNIGLGSTPSWTSADTFYFSTVANDARVSLAGLEQCGYRDSPLSLDGGPPS